MRTYKNKTKNILYLFYRLFAPIVDPLLTISSIRGYYKYLKDAVVYMRLSDHKQKVFGINMFPKVNEYFSTHELDAHYFYQQLWLFEKVYNVKPKLHVDVGSTYTLSGYISKITKSEYVDIRKVNVKLKNYEVRVGDLTKLPYKDNQLVSVSCLHVLEHVGLGRYGDSIDPEGMDKAIVELIRVLKPGGRLYVSTPIGKERLCFNAYRVSNPVLFRKKFEGLDLIEFSLVDDRGVFKQFLTLSDLPNLSYGCGMYIFQKSI